MKRKKIEMGGKQVGREYRDGRGRKLSMEIMEKARS